jgi:hypothetical protein
LSFVVLDLDDDVDPRTLTLTATLTLTPSSTLHLDARTRVCCAGRRSPKHAATRVKVDNKDGVNVAVNVEVGVNEDDNVDVDVDVDDDDDVGDHSLDVDLVGCAYVNDARRVKCVGGVCLHPRSLENL